MDIVDSACINTIRKGVDTWLQTSVTVNGEFVGSKLRELIDFVATRYKTELETLMRSFHNREKYPIRPMVQVYGCKGSQDDILDIWLLGWRDDQADPEETEIHDHDDSHVVVRVLKGSVTEVVYELTGDSNHSGAYEVLLRELRRGETEEIGAPAIHQVADLSDGEMSVTLHAYYPPLDKMMMYTSKGDQLKPTEEWVKDPSDTCT